MEVLGAEKRKESEAAVFSTHELEEALGLMFEVRVARDVAEATLQVGGRFGAVCVFSAGVLLSGIGTHISADG